MTTEIPAWFTRAVKVPGATTQVDVDGCEIAYRRWGSGSLSPVLLIHGGGANTVWWDHVAPQLAEDRTVVALDLSGHGDSGHRDAYDVNTWATEVTAVARSAGLGAPVVIGHSLGGIVALEVASRVDPPPLTIVIDSAISVAAQKEWEWMLDINLSTPKHYDDVETLVRRFRPTPIDDSNRPYITDRIARRSVRKATDGWRWKLDPRIFGRPRWDPREITRVRGRVAVVQAERGTAGTDVADVAVRTFGEDTLTTVVANSGHHIMLDQPEELVRELKQQLSTVDAGGFSGGRGAT